MDKTDIINSFVSELRRGTVVLCVLASLSQPAYGYELIERLSQSGLAVEANTLYPLLRRLEGQGLLHSSWNTEGTKPRKYYSRTTLGDQVLAELKVLWGQTTQNVSRILEG